MNNPQLIIIDYYQQFNNTWDSYVDNRLLVKAAKNITVARVFSDTMLNEEYDSYIIAKENINYFVGDLK